VETLLTLQAENLGGVVEPMEEAATSDFENLSESASKTALLFVCDSRTTTFQLIKDLSDSLKQNGGLKVVASDPKKLESAVPSLKEKMVTIPRPAPNDRDETLYDQGLLGPGGKLFVGTAAPDPLFGLADAKVEACLGWIGNSRRISTQAATVFDPSPFEKTESYESVEQMSSRIVEASFVDVIPRGGKIRSVMQDAPFDAIRNGFYSVEVAQARALVIGAGGAGYDDTLSGALRSVWNVIDGVRKSGEILIVAECSDGLGSKALEMLVSGRMGQGARRTEKYVEGIEEVSYVEALKGQYDVMLMSGMPELYVRSKLGFGAAKGSGEALGKLLNKVGRTAKLNVVTRASESRIALS
jgi:hypothetical protein